MAKLAGHHGSSRGICQISPLSPAGPWTVRPPCQSASQVARLRLLNSPQASLRRAVRSLWLACKLALSIWEWAQDALVAGLAWGKVPPTSSLCRFVRSRGSPCRCPTAWRLHFAVSSLAARIIGSTERCRARQLSRTFLRHSWRTKHFVLVG